jgi:hypothetical protein
MLIGLYNTMFQNTGSILPVMQTLKGTSLCVSLPVIARDHMFIDTKTWIASPVSFAMVGRRAEGCISLEWCISCAEIGYK